jgi:hypothetical protein
MPSNKHRLNFYNINILIINQISLFNNNAKTLINNNLRNLIPDIDNPFYTQAPKVGI